jgi:hypothetical protein
MQPAPVEKKHALRRLQWTLVLTLAASLVSCRSYEAEPQVLSVPQLLKQSNKKLAVGAPCPGGPVECQSGICLNSRAPRSADEMRLGYVCSRTCVSDEDCPQLWACRSISDAPNSSVCSPLPEWKTGAGIALRKSVGELPKQPPSLSLAVPYTVGQPEGGADGGTQATQGTAPR